MATNYILVKLDPEVLKEVDARCGGPAKPFQSGGRADFVRELIYKEVGFAPKNKPKYKNRGRGINLPLHLIDMQDLQPLENLLVSLALRGNNFAQITRYCRDNKIVPLPGSQRWHSQQVERILNQVIARNYSKTSD